MLALAVWMLVRVHRQLPSRGGRWLLYPVIAVLALAAIGAATSPRVKQPMPRPPDAWQLLEVGRHRPHLRGTGAGPPTMVLEPGAGERSSKLGWITPAVAHDTRVWVSDRAGRGWSEPAATDPHRLLERGQARGPEVLAGHSFGGLEVLSFAARAPDQAAAMVLVDSTAPAAAANPGTPSPGQGRQPPHERCLGTGVDRRPSGSGPPYAQSTSGSLAPRSRAEARASDPTQAPCTAPSARTSRRTASTEQAAALGDLADSP